MCKKEEGAATWGEKENEAKIKEKEVFKNKVHRKALCPFGAIQNVWRRLGWFNPRVLGEAIRC